MRESRYGVQSDLGSFRATFHDQPTYVCDDCADHVATTLAQLDLVVAIHACATGILDQEMCRQARERAGLSRAELAKELSVDEDRIRRLEDGSEPLARKLQKKFLGVLVEALWKIPS